MPRLERLALADSLIRFDALLPEPNRLDLVALFGNDNVRFRRVAGRALGLVITRDACPL